MIRKASYNLARSFLRIGVDPTLRNLIGARPGADNTSYIDRLLRHACGQVPYYSRAVRAAASGDLTLPQFPILTKHQIRKHFLDLCAVNSPSRRICRNSSGGSTGEPVTLLQDDVYEKWMAASEDYFYTRFLDLEDYYVAPRLILWGSEKDIFGAGVWRRRLTDLLCRRTTVNAFRLSEEAFEHCVQFLRTGRPVLVKGYAGALNELAGYILDRGIEIPGPKAVYSAAEVLYPFMRDRIQRAFRARVHDFYGSREVGPIAGECPAGGLHVFTFNTHVEIIRDDGREASPGEEGRVIVTALHNFSMPLIRYDIGDRAVRGTTCPCGSALPVLSALKGRSTDQFVAADGTLVSGEYFTHLLYFREWIRQFQVHQMAVGQLRILYVGETPAKGDLAEIENKIRMALGNNCAAEWRRVEELPWTPQGKRLYTISHVARATPES